MHTDQQSKQPVSRRMAGTALLAVSLVSFFPASAQTNLSPVAKDTEVVTRPAQLESVRVQADADSVQVTLDLQAAVHYKSGWLAPGLLYLDLLSTEIGPQVQDREISVNQRYLKRIWIGQERSNVTRVVFALNIASRHTISALEDPTRLVLELKGSDAIWESPDEPASEPNVKESAPGKDDLLEAHTHHFTYAENIGHADGGVPATQFLYCTTRHPIVLDRWAGGTAPLNGHPLRFTTIANSCQTGRDAEWKGETYTWSKHHEFLKLLDLPGRIPLRLELALACDDAQVLGVLQQHGWLVTNAIPLSTEIDRYREYILGSLGEFTVAKDQNVRLRSGWFSDRSACYLAAGKPIITQDTRFDCALPTGEGLFAFRDKDEAIAAAETIVADYARQSRAARLMAHDYFRAEAVLSRLLAEADL